MAHTILQQPTKNDVNGTTPRNRVASAKLPIAQFFGLSAVTILFIGIVIGYCIPLVIDYVLFGSIVPCQTIQVFEDGSAIQKCQVRG